MLKSENPSKSVFVCHLLTQFIERDDGKNTQNFIYEKSRKKGEKKEKSTTEAIYLQ